MPITIVDAGFRSTHYWVVSAGTSRMLVDLGWPGSLGTLRATLNRLGVPLAELRCGLATHYHIDHAGAAEDLKRAGVPLLVMENQVAAIPLMRRHIKPHDNYTEITPDGNIVISFAESRAWLAGIGIAGQVVATPGHSDDSVSLLLDDGLVFTGDLTPLAYLGDDEPGRVSAQSWQRLKDLGARRVCPAHGEPYDL
jgi:endoribonuclease LACTB2